MQDNELKEFNSKDILKRNVDMKKYIEELLAELKADNDVYESLKPLGLTNKEVRDNIGRLHDYQEDFNVCKTCPGFDKCPKKEKHISMYVYKDGSYITTRSEPCKELIKEMEIDSKYVAKDFPQEWKTSVLKNLDLSENRRPLIKEFVNIAKGKSNKWLYVQGNHKVGKSFVLVTFANEFVALGLGKVAVINAAKQFKNIADMAYSDKEGFKNAIDLLETVPLLVIDEFGQEYKNELIRDQIVIPILNARAHSELPTFFSSEFTIKEVQTLYSIGKNSGAIRGKQLGSLLTDMCEKEYDLTGASIYRK